MKELIKLLKTLKKKDVLVVAHETPDGDAIGSSLGFARLLKELGARILLLNKDEIPHKYRFLENSIKFCKPGDVSQEVRNRPYMAFILDTATPERIGFDLREDFPEVLETVCIDHHISNKQFADHNYVYPDKGATSEIVGDLYLDILGFVPKDAATAIYTGIMTDTGNLTYESTTSATVALVSILLEMGADFNLVRRKVHENDTAGQMGGLKVILNNLKLQREGMIAYTSISRSDVEELGLRPSDIENYVEYPRRVDTCEIAILFKEFEQDVIRVSVRTKGVVDANKLAASFGGGGHKRASGFRVRRPMHEAVDFVLNKLDEGLDHNEWLD